jgi:LAO/AO transport system kinase
VSLVERFRAGDQRALARLISLVENGDPAADEALVALGTLPRPRLVLGITGPPGAGKSTLIGALVRHWRQQGEPVAILAVDPSSARSGGAALGDRLRLGELQADPDIFFRSMAARGQLGGLAAATARVVGLLAAFGFQRVVLETVGVGQGEIDIRQWADVVVVMQAPGLGDEVQAIKAGVLEIADIIAVTKADQPGAAAHAAHLRALIGADPGGPRVLTVSGTSGEGVAALAAAIDEFGAETQAADTAVWARAQIVEQAAGQLRRELANLAGLDALAERVATGELSINKAATALIGELRRTPDSDGS